MQSWQTICHGLGLESVRAAFQESDKISLHQDSVLGFLVNIIKNLRAILGKPLLNFGCGFMLFSFPLYCYRFFLFLIPTGNCKSYDQKVNNPRGKPARQLKSRLSSKIKVFIFTNF